MFFLVLPDDIVLVGDLLHFNKVFNFPSTSQFAVVNDAFLWTKRIRKIVEDTE